MADEFCDEPWGGTRGRQVKP